MCGGVVGANATSGTNIIQYCYNTGKVEGTECFGGIAGFSRRNQILYSYNIGEVIGATTVGGCIGDSDNDTKTNIYYLKDKVKINNTVSNVAYSSTADAACLKTETQFKNAVTQTTESVTYLLNGNKNTGAWAVSSSKNGGYPYLTAFDNTNIWAKDTEGNLVLKWQLENTTNNI